MANENGFEDAVIPPPRSRSVPARTQRLAQAPVICASCLRSGTPTPCDGDVRTQYATLRDRLLSPPEEVATPFEIGTPMQEDMPFAMSADLPSSTGTPDATSTSPSANTSTSTSPSLTNSHSTRKSSVSSTTVPLPPSRKGSKASVDTSTGPISPQVEILTPGLPGTMSSRNERARSRNRKRREVEQKETKKGPTLVGRWRSAFKGAFNHEVDESQFVRLENHHWADDS